MNQVLFPDFNGLVVLVQRLVAVGQTEQRIVIAGMTAQTAGIIADGVLELVLLALGVAETDQRIVIVFFKLKNLVKILLGGVQVVFFKCLISFL